MKTKSRVFAGIVFVFILHSSFFCLAERPVPIQLPNPQTETGKPLMAALSSRMSTRSFSGEKLGKQDLSNLLWAAFGINRENGKAPSATNWREIDIYVITADGAYLYNLRKNTLNTIQTNDIRAMAGTQSFVKDAAVNLIYVADYSRVDEETLDVPILVGADTGFISENVYLFCASEGFATIVLASINRDLLAKELKLSPEQRIILAQSVGYPK